MPHDDLYKTTLNDRNMRKLENKVAIITGGASGIGADTAKLFAAEGSSVVITDINGQKLEQTAGIIANAGGTVLPIVQDVTSEDDWNKVVERTMQQFGKINILFNNAGIEVRVDKWEDMPLEEFRRVLDVNLTSQFLGVKAVVGKMIASGGGSIINMSSTAGFIATDADPAYTAAKGGARLFTKSAALKYALSNVRVNSIHPGITLTEMTSLLEESEEGRKYLRSLNPMQRAGTPREISNAVLFLASDDSSYVTGTELIVDGGQTAI